MIRRPEHCASFASLCTPRHEEHGMFWLLHKDNADETHAPKLHTNNFAVGHRNAGGKMKILKKYLTY